MDVHEKDLTKTKVVFGATEKVKEESFQQDVIG